MSAGLLLDGVSAANMLAVLASVWWLSAGRTGPGNWAMLAASATGLALGALLVLWPLALLNVVLLARSAWMLYKGRGSW